MDSTLELFREQPLTQVLQKAHLDYTVTDANYNKSAFSYVDPYPTP